MSLLRIATTLLACAVGGVGARAEPNSAQAWFQEEGYVPPSAGRIIACHGYGCSRRMEVEVKGSWFGRIDAIMRRGRASPAAERKAVGEALRVYTAYLSSRFGGLPDQPRSPPSMSGVIGQMDCLDETANTTSLLLVLKQEGLLTYHEVDRPQSRGIFIDGRYPHFTAVIVDSRTHGAWAIDPWAVAPGQRPDLLPLEEWQKAS